MNLAVSGNLNGKFHVCFNLHVHVSVDHFFFINSMYYDINLNLVVFILLQPALYSSVIFTENKVGLDGSARLIMVSVTRKTVLGMLRKCAHAHSEEVFDAAVIGSLE